MNAVRQANPMSDCSARDASSSGVRADAADDMELLAKGSGLPACSGGEAAAGPGPAGGAGAGGGTRMGGAAIGMPAAQSQSSCTAVAAREKSPARLLRRRKRKISHHSFCKRPS